MKEESKADRNELVLSFLEVLGAAGVPVPEYEPCYRQARLMRADLVKNGKQPPFHLTPEELVAAWLVRVKKLAEETPAEKNPAQCSNKHNHIDGEAISLYQPLGREAVILPCHGCRPQAHEQRRKDDKRKYEQEIIANRKRLSAPEPKPAPKKPEVEEIRPSGELCKNCGKLAGERAVKTPPNFLVCAECHEIVKNADLRKIPQNALQEK